ncbi:MAG: helix-turn-helix domain-containing protein [Candidatus Heimdallarchaeota archaeon]|nr:helix-turn-helix domain-containing protein [Candidatus Heimdallarchaeota archaeon]MCK5049447.1 helix-turn-helix domain-containing protein [Candidatus Heimdallarchaeota archaeon]
MEEKPVSRIGEAEIKLKMLGTIRKASGGITHGELTDETGLHRNTVYKYLQQLADEGHLTKKTYGRTDVWSISQTRFEEMFYLPKRMLQSLAVALQKIDGLTDESKERMRKLAQELIISPEVIKEEMAIPIIEELIKLKNKDLAAFFQRLNDFSQIHPKNKTEITYLHENQSGEITLNNCICNGTKGNELVCTFIEGALEGIFETRLKLPLKIRENSCGIENGTKKCIYHFEVLSPPNKSNN